MKKLNIIELFAGCGGLADGFLQTGKYKTLATVDWEKATFETIKKRFQSKWGYKNTDNINLHFDIQRVEELLNGYDDLHFGKSEGLNKLVGGNQIDLVTGGPPCQAYSVAGRIRDENGMHDDYRNFLFESYVKVVDHFKPRAFVFENVEGILSAKPGGVQITERICNDFKKIGYTVLDNLRDAVINSAEYGVPQIRKRVIIVGLKADSFESPQNALKDFYENKLTEHKSKLLTVKDAIGDLPKLFPTEEYRYKGRKLSHSIGDITCPNHLPRFHNVRDQEIFRELATDFAMGRVKYPDADSLIQLYKEKTGRTTSVHKYHVLTWDKPSNTIPAHLYKDGLRHIHPDPDQARSITVREAARIQTFDDDFEFLGSMGDQYKMIGNAVPPKLGCHIGNSVAQILSEN